MNKVIAGIFAVALMGTSLVMADMGAPSSAAKDLKKIVEEGPYVETSQTGIKLSGYVDAGYQYNFAGKGSARTATFGNYALGNGMPRTASDAKHKGDFDLNAFKLVIEKPLSDANELQAGFRADLMYGEDANVFGQEANNSDSLFLEQAYVQFRLPYGNGIDFKVGKFVTILGYEVIERPANLNITYGNLFTNAIPLWHTGMLMAYRVNDIVDLQLGVVNGVNNDNGIGGAAAPAAAVRDAEDNAAILASVNLTVPGGNANWYNAVMYGINGDGVVGNGAAGNWDDAPMIVYDTWMQWVPKDLDDKLLLAANFNIGNAAVATNIGVPGTTGEPNTTTWWGAALYVKYQFTDIFSLAHRFDYIHNDDSNAFGNDQGNGIDVNEDIWSYTATASFDVIENMMLRTEYRLDWGDDITTTAGPGGANSTIFTDGPVHTAAVQVVYSF